MAGVAGVARASMMINCCPTYWQKVFTGAVILIGTGATARRIAATRQRLAAVRKA